jgi:methylthioribose-1-phosphate isomerase
MRQEIAPIRWRQDGLELLDQTLLPAEERWLRCGSVQSVCDAIRRLAVRGAPAIGVAAAYGLVLGARCGLSVSAAVAELGSTRPTAVNLRWALGLGETVWRQALARGEAPQVALLAWAKQVQADDVAACRRMGELGAELFRPGDRVLTHCNAGALATAGWGTAVGVIRAAHERFGLGLVWVDETRPLLQGARLTAWECQQTGVPYRVVTDSSVGALMSRGLVDRVIVGADRIAANGDTANKIGTYTVAVLAHRHGVPFLVAAPLSTIDPRTATGAQIPIEERDETEVTGFHGLKTTPPEARALNFAFDVTPAELIAAIVTERGVLRPPYEAAIAGLFG